MLGRDFVLRHQFLVAVIAIICAFAATQGKRVLANRAAFQWEDRAFIQHNAREIHSVRECFTERPLWPGLYRPLTTNLYYFVGQKIFNNRIEVYHLINVILYLLNGFLLFLIAKRIMSYPWALVPPLLLVSRFSHVEVVTNTCEFQSLLSVFFTLLAFELFIAANREAARPRDVWPLVVFALALLSKETAVVLPALLLIYRQLFDRHGSWRRYLGPWIVALVWVVLFAFVLRRASEGTPTGFSYNFSFSRLAGNYAAYLLSFSNLLTHGLASIVMVPRVATLANAAAARACVVLILLAALALLVFGRRLHGVHPASASAFAFGVLFFYVATAPYVILESRLFMRYAYFGHAGLAIASAGVIREAVEAARAAIRRLRPSAPFRHSDA